MIWTCSLCAKGRPPCRMELPGIDEIVPDFPCPADGEPCEWKPEESPETDENACNSSANDLYLH